MIPNATYYLKENVVEIGEGIPRNAIDGRTSPRSTPARARAHRRRRLCRRVLGAKRWPADTRTSGSDWSCGGLEEWGKKFSVEVTSMSSDPASPDIDSLVLQLWRPAPTPS